jgi:hypothetical protein
MSYSSSPASAFGGALTTHTRHQPYPHTSFTVFLLTQQSYEVDIATVPIFQLGKLRLTEVKLLDPDTTAIVLQGWDLNPFPSTHLNHSQPPRK